jgi:hypothetical protein
MLESARQTGLAKLKKGANNNNYPQYTRTSHFPISSVSKGVKIPMTVERKDRCSMVKKGLNNPSPNTPAD